PTDPVRQSATFGRARVSRRWMRFCSRRSKGRRFEMTNKYTGRCFCGAVTLEVSGAPEAMGYCHCSSCRSWSAGPVNAFTLWKPESIKVTKGAAFIGKFAKTPGSERQYCTKCGGH